jgi:hypothetical protein
MPSHLDRPNPLLPLPQVLSEIEASLAAPSSTAPDGPPSSRGPILLPSSAWRRHLRHLQHLPPRRLSLLHPRKPWNPRLRMCTRASRRRSGSGHRTTARKSPSWSSSYGRPTGPRTTKTSRPQSTTTADPADELCSEETVPFRNGKIVPIEKPVCHSRSR